MKLLEKTEGQLLNTYRGHTNESYHVGSCFSSSDAHVCTGGENGSITFYDLVEASVVRTLKGHKRAVTHVSYHPKVCVQVCVCVCVSGGV